MTDQYNMPALTREALDRYFEHRIPPGSFLTAVLSNDLFGALGRADEDNRAAIFEICRFIYNEAPAVAWGSPAAFDAWIGGRE